MRLVVNPAQSKDPNEQPQCNRQHLLAFWRLGVIVILGVVFLLTQSTKYAHHFHAHIAKHSVLRNLQEQPALRLTFHVKRKAMYVHGASIFDVIATLAPKRSADDRRIAYNRMALFEEDGHSHEYSLVDGTTYYRRRPTNQFVSNATTGCLPSGSVPPIESVLNVIEAASTVPPSTFSSKLCPNGSVMMFQFAGEDFVLCSRHSAWPWLQEDNGFQIFGKHVNIRVKYEQSAPVIVAPHVSTKELILCGKVPFGNHTIPSLQSFLTQDFSRRQHRSLRAEKAELNFFTKAVSFVKDKVEDVEDKLRDDKCCCKGAKRPCVFIAGLSSHIDYGLTTTDPQTYFGNNINDHTPCCTTRQYITLATMENRWDEPLFQQRMVDLLLQVSNTSDIARHIVNDTIIVCHSMANLILSGAIATGKMILAASTSWLAASAPMTGSMGSNYIQKSCGGEKGEFVESIVTLLGDCPVTSGELSLAYQSSKFSSSPLNKAYMAAQAAYTANVDAVICSNSFTGLMTARSAIYVLAGKVIPHHSSENDGIVEYASCAGGLPHETFNAIYKSSRYKTKLNHVDIAFRNGDGLFSDAKKPLKWLECVL